MKHFFRVMAQSDTFAVPSQKAEGGQISKCNIVLRELGGKYENSYVATMLGEQANMRFAKKQHAKTGLANTAADGERKFAI